MHLFSVVFFCSDHLISASSFGAASVAEVWQELFAARFLYKFFHFGCNCVTQVLHNIFPYHITVTYAVVRESGGLKL